MIAEARAPEGRLLDRLRALPASRRSSHLMQVLGEYVRQKLHLDGAELEPRTPLMSLGMSSLQSVEVKMYLEKELEAQLPTSLVFDYPTLAALVPEILRRAGLEAEAPRGAASDQSVAEQLAAELADLRRQGAP